jgi:hypothetical protein
VTYCAECTPVDDHMSQLGLVVKREDLSCPGGPNFSKTRGVWEHVASRPERLIGVLDTSHSQGGWAVARACAEQGKQCVNYYPLYKHRQECLVPPVQERSISLGAELRPLPAGRSAVLYHRARREVEELGGYMMPNALKLPETVAETAREVGRTFPRGLAGSCLPVLVSASSGTVAAGVLRGLVSLGWDGPLIVHLGYSRPHGAVRMYIGSMSGVDHSGLVIIDEGYAYKDRARPGAAALPFPSNDFYDRKAVSWWLREGRAQWRKALLWNVG